LIIALIVLSSLLAWELAHPLREPEKIPPPVGFSTLLEDKDVNAIATTDDAVWAGGATGLFRIDKATLETEEIPGYIYVRALCAEEGNLWIGHENGLSVMKSDGSTVTYRMNDGMPADSVRCIFREPGGPLWIGTGGGAVCFDGAKFSRILKKEHGLLNDMVNVMASDDAGGLWFGSYDAPRGGISVLKGGTWQHFTTDDGLPHTNITSIVNLPDGSMMAGCGLYNKGGAIRFERSKNGWIVASILTKDDGLAGEKVRSLFTDSVGNLWAGSEYDGLAIFTPEGIAELGTSTGLCNNEIKTIVRDVNDIWLGTNCGAMKIEEREMMKIVAAATATTAAN
jgi:ligand-binding sensor domain-containing protein